MAACAIAAMSYEIPWLLIPPATLVAIYVIMDRKYQATNTRNMIKLNYMIDQNNYFESLRKEANEVMDLLEAKDKLEQ